jgi:branched-chain amino acid transport system permease protein
MDQRLLRLGLLAGIAGSMVVILFGGWTPIPIALVLGAAIGLLISQQIHGRDLAWPAALAGGIAAVCLTIATLIYHVAIAPAAGLDAAFPPLVVGNQSFAFGFAGVLVAGLLSVVLSGGLAALTVTLENVADERRRQINTYAIIGVLAVLYPLVLTFLKLDIKWLDPIVASLIFVLPALGLNIVVGYAGLLDLGYVAFFAIGAYGTAFLASNYHGVAWPFFLAIWFAAVITALSGLVLGAPTLPLRGDYLAIVTLGFGEIIPVVFRNLNVITIHEPLSGVCLIGCDKPFNLTNGVIGINPVFRPVLPFIGAFKAGEYLPWYYLMIALIVLSLFLISRLRGSRLGRAWVAMREDELAAAQMGIDIVHTKLLAFAMGATFAGFAGAFAASYTTFVEPNAFDFAISVIILVMVILGGMGNMTGAIVGAMLVGIVDRLWLKELATVSQKIIATSIVPGVHDPKIAEFLTRSLDPAQMRLLLFGLALVIVMVVRPEGLIPSERRRRELHKDEPSATPAAESKGTAS